MVELMTSPSLKRLSAGEIDARLKQCPPLPSLSSINQALQDLVLAEQRFSAQIAEIISRDPSLTARLLRLVNSVYYGLSAPVNSIEEAVFYLGIRQIRQLTMVTPVIEDFQRLTGWCRFPWREFWQHCIGTAILTREVISAMEVPADDSAYLAGLVHDVGKIVIAWAFPKHFSVIHHEAVNATENLRAIEERVLGLNHADLGAAYLRHQRLPASLIAVAQFHHHPQDAGPHQVIAAATQIADLLLRHARIGQSGDFTEITREDCQTASGWDILFANHSEDEHAIARASLNRTLERLPGILEGLV